MNTFEYQAINSEGKTLTGFIDAENLKQAQERLSVDGLFPIDIVATQDEAKVAKTKAKHRLSIFKPRIKLLDISLATRQLATLIGAGLPLAECLNSVLEQTEKKSIKASACRRPCKGYRRLFLS